MTISWQTIVLVYSQMRMMMNVFLFLLFYRAKLDDNPKLLDFTEKLEAACIGTVESGKMTKDLALIIHGPK